MKFEEKLQSLRKKSNLSQEALADKLGVSRQAVSKWESGTSYPEMDKLIMMSRIFKCSLDDLVNDSVNDREVIEHEENDKLGYINSFMNFILKSVKMFCSMKFSSVIKCLLEMFGVGCLLLTISLIIHGLVYTAIYYLTYNNSSFIIGWLVLFFYFIFIAIIVIVDVIIFYQVYKIRYLDYFDQLSYTKNQTKEEDKKENHNENIGKIKLNKEADRIIIRDPKDRPIRIFKILADVIVAFVKCIATLTTSMLFFGILLLSIGICFIFYLIFINKIFIGVFVAAVCALIVLIYLTILIINFILNRKSKIMPFVITLITCIIVCSMGITYSIISLKNFEIIRDNVKHDKLEIDMHDDLIFTNTNNEIIYEIDDNLKNIVVEYDATNGYNEVGYKKIGANNYQFYVSVKEDELTSFERINSWIKDLKNNKINVDYYLDDTIIIKGNKENINKLIKNTSKYKKIEYYFDTFDRIKIEYGNYVHNNNYCKLNELGYYDCYDVQNRSNCKIDLTENGPVSSENNCYCEKSYGEYSYKCHNR